MNEKMERMLEKSKKYITTFIVIKVIFLNGNKVADMIMAFTIYPLATIVGLIGIYQAYKTKNKDELKKMGLYLICIIALFIIQYIILQR